MTSSATAHRRALMAAFATLTLSSAAKAERSESAPRKATSRTLVAYFSRSGNTRVVAGLIQRARAADLFEIRPAKPYPDDYLATVEQARQERDRGDEPALEVHVREIGAYDTVYLGFPIWGETAPPVIRSFLSAHDLSGKSLVPFVTHGGYGIGNSQAVLAKGAPKANLRRGFVMQGDQERQTMNLVTQWLDEIEAKKI